MSYSLDSPARILEEAKRADDSSSYIWATSDSSTTRLPCQISASLHLSAQHMASSNEPTFYNVVHDIFPTPCSYSLKISAYNDIIYSRLVTTY